MPCAVNGLLALSQGRCRLLDADRSAIARVAAFPVRTESPVFEDKELDGYDRCDDKKCGEQKDSHHIAASKSVPSRNEHVGEAHRCTSTRMGHCPTSHVWRPGVIR